MLTTVVDISFKYICVCMYIFTYIYISVCVTTCMFKNMEIDKTPIVLICVLENIDGHYIFISLALSFFES